jgi:flagellin
MSLGVLNNLSAVYAENNLNNTTNSLNTVLQQLSSGSKINSGADDAAGLSLVNGLQANQQALNQSQTNATEGVGLLQVADGALSQVTSLLNRAVTLATEASNGTLNSSQDTAANQEYQSILSEINNIGTTTTFNQRTVFGSNTNIYTGDSSAQGAAINDLNIGSLSSSNVGDTGGTMAYSSGQTASNVFLDLSNDGTNAQLGDSLGATSDTTTIQVTYQTTGNAGAPVSNSAPIQVGYGTQYSNTVGGLIDAINGSGLGLSASLTTAQNAGAGAVASALAANNGGGSASDTGIMISGVGVGVAGTGTNGIGVVGQLALTGATGDSVTGGTLNIVGSDGKSHNVVLGETGSSDSLAHLAATVNAGNYGVTATVGTGTNANVLTFTSANSAVSVSGTGITNTVAAFNNSAPAGDTAITTTTLPAGALAEMQLNSANDTITGPNNVAVKNSAGTGETVDLSAGLTFSQMQAAFAVDGINATLNNDTVTFTAAVPNSKAAITATAANAVTDSSAAQTNAPVSITDAPTSGAQFSSQVGTIGIDSAGTYSDTLSGSLTIGGIGSSGGQTINIVSGYDSTLQSLAGVINSGDYGVTATYSQTNADIVFTSANSATTINATSLTDGAKLFATNTPTDSSAYYSVGIASSGGVVDQTTVVNTGSSSTPILTYGGTGSPYINSGPTAAVVGNTGFTSDLSGTNGIATISYTDAAGQSLKTSDLSSQGDAQTALTSLNSAISDVAAQDGYIGAQINQLNAASSVLSTQSENVQSAQNAVQATDYASATANMSKYEILSQTGISALAQANSMQQEVTKLLQ